MRFLHFLQRYFSFNKQERNGLLVLSTLLIITFLFKCFLPVLLSKKQSVVLLTIPGDSIPNGATRNKKYTFKNQKEGISNQKITLFTFDPNSISHEQALQLGFPKKTAAILMKYRQKGGKFKQAEDLKKLYGLPEVLYNQLQPYIIIPQTAFKDSVRKYSTTTYTKTPKAIVLVDINNADSLMLLDLKGIGPALTRRILKYRKALGGFHSFAQLKEVYGIKDSVLMKLQPIITIKENTWTMIDINTVSYEALKSHPYFTFQTARAVINYRLKHGKINQIDFSSLGVFDEEKLMRVLPYLKF